MNHDLLQIPFDNLAAAAGSLRGGGSLVESLKSDPPDETGAGDFSGDASAVIAHLLAAAGQVAIGLNAVGDAVATAADSYRSADQAARDRVSLLWTN